MKVPKIEIYPALPRSVLLLLLLCSGCKQPASVAPTAPSSEAGAVASLRQVQRRHVPPDRSNSPTSPHRPESVSDTTTARSAKSIFPKRSVQAAPSSTTTTTAGKTSCSLIRQTGLKTRNANRFCSISLMNGTFTDVTHQVGLGVEMYGIGVAIADYDNDDMKTPTSRALVRINSFAISATESFKMREPVSAILVSQLRQRGSTSITTTNSICLSAITSSGHQKPISTARSTGRTNRIALANLQRPEPNVVSKPGQRHV